MDSSANWQSLSSLLTDQFSSISSNRSVVSSALGFLKVWLTDDKYESYRPAILAHIEAEEYELLLDSFYQLLPFGTGGRRGRVGFGPNRINKLTFSFSVQGHCNYLRKTFPDHSTASVVVAYDTRIFKDISQTYDFLGTDNPLLNLTSRALAHDACEIYAENGFVVHAPDLMASTAYLSTPELSFSIRHLRALGGINVSASHNHPDDNGFKFYNIEGAQDIPPKDEELASFMHDIEQVSSMPFDTARREQKILFLDTKTHQSFVDTNLRLRTNRNSPKMPIVYTPLCGTGDSTVGEVLRAAGYDVKLFQPQANYDGTFSTVPLRLPNPEVPEAAAPALSFAEAEGARLVLSTDPDADRIGVFAQDRTGGWRYLTGNDIASVLTYYLVLDKHIGPQKTGLIIKTLVTTRTLENIAKRGGCHLIGDLLVGFKYIAHVLKELEDSGQFLDIKAKPQDMIIAAEESHGVLLTPDIRDKDAAGGALVLCELNEHLNRAEQRIPEYLDSLIVECGNYANAARSIVMRGIQGTERLEQMMISLRQDPPEKLDGLVVSEVIDYRSQRFGPLKSSTDALSRNLLLYHLDGAQIVIRPSGTEPKVKIYVDVEGQKLVSPDDLAGAARLARKLADLFFETCLDRIGIKLSPSASALPDYVDLNLRLDFDRSFQPDLVNQIQTLANSDETQMADWFRLRLAPYGAGADPLQTTTDAIVQMCTSLSETTNDPQLRHLFTAVRDRLRNRKS